MRGIAGMPKLSRLVHVLFGICIATHANGSSLLDMGSFTRDLATGLDWLDLNASQDRSYLDVTAQFAVGGDFEGYRYATVNEVRTFWVNAGLVGGTPQLCTGSPFCFAETYPAALVQHLASLVGYTFKDVQPNYTLFGAWGITGSALVNAGGCPPTSSCRAITRFRFSDPELTPAEAIVIGALRDDISDRTVASWLVREAPVSPVPLSSTALFQLTGLGLLCLLVWHRKRKLSSLGAGVPALTPRA